MKKTHTIALFEGHGVISSDDFNDLLEETEGIIEFEPIGEYDNLYILPEKLDKLTIDDPDFIYINSTGLYSYHITRLIERFKFLNYTPKNVLFGTLSTTIQSFPSELLETLFQQGTKFWSIADTTHDFIKNIEDFKGK